MKEYIKRAMALNADDPEEIVKGLQNFLNDNTLSPEQKLYAFGYLVNKNKEYYILDLKEQIKKAHLEIQQLKFPKKEKELPKKKVVIVKKKHF